MHQCTFLRVLLEGLAQLPLEILYRRFMFLLGLVFALRGPFALRVESLFAFSFRGFDLLLQGGELGLTLCLRISDSLFLGLEVALQLFNLLLV